MNKDTFFADAVADMNRRKLELEKKMQYFRQIDKEYNERYHPELSAGGATLTSKSPGKG